MLLQSGHPMQRMPSFYQHADTLLESLQPDRFFSMTLRGKIQSYLVAGISVLGMLNGEDAQVIGGQTRICLRGVEA